ncbi:MAG: conjugal transfer protein TrbL family protein [Bacilli bacterium]
MILTFDKAGWFNNNIRGFFSTIDHLIYSLLSWIIEGIFNLSNLTSSPAFTQTIYKRIYLILGVYMIFKLSFSFLKYLVNPDSMTDKEQGVGKLIARTVTMVCMLILLPIIFFTDGLIPGTKGTVLNVLQDGVLKTIPNIIFGAESNQESVAETADESGDYLALMMLRSFYYPKECSDNNADTNVCDISGEGKNTKVISSLDDFTETINDKDWDNVYDYQYMWPLTTVAGVLLVVIMLGIAIDVAIRVFKLILLQMMAPIPVMSYIDPKSSKDGAFNSWLKTFISTYIDIFVKLAVVYLILLLASKLFAGNGKGLFTESISNVDGFMSRNFVRVFLVIGLFKFAKDAPKFIKDAMGIKDSGGGGGFMGKALAGMAGAAAGFAGGVAAGGGIAGGLAGAAGGFSAGAANAGSGKPLGVYGKTRDEMAKSLGKTPGGVKGKMQLAANKRALAKMGVSEGTLDKAKVTMLDDEANATAAEDYFEQAKKNMSSDGTSWYVDKDGVHHAVGGKDGETMETLATNATTERDKAIKSKKRFEKMDEAYKPYKKGFYDEHHRGLVDNVKGKAETAYNAVRHPIQNIKDVGASAKQAVGDIAKDTFSIRNDSDKRYNERRNDQRAKKFEDKNRDHI